MKKIAYVLAMVLLVNLMSCAKQQSTAHLNKPKVPVVLVEEIGDITIFTANKDIGSDDVLKVLTSLLVLGPGVDSILIRTRAIIVHLSDMSEKNKKALLGRVEKVLKLRFDTKEIVFIYASNYPKQEDLAQVIAENMFE
jgi:hypothetical protein